MVKKSNIAHISILLIAILLIANMLYIAINFISTDNITAYLWYSFFISFFSLVLYSVITIYDGIIWSYLRLVFSYFSMIGFIQLGILLSLNGEWSTQGVSQSGPIKARLFIGIINLIKDIGAYWWSFIFIVIGIIFIFITLKNFNLLLENKFKGWVDP